MESLLYNNSISSKAANAILIIGLLFSAFVNFYSESANGIALHLVIPAMFGLCVILNPRGLFRGNKYVTILSWLLLWIVVSYLWAAYSVPAVRQLKQIFGTFLLAIIISTIAKKESYIPWLYIAYIALFAGAWIYASNNIIGIMDEYHNRMEDERLNANQMAYMLFYVTFGVYVLAEISKKRIVMLFWKVLFLGMIPLSYITALLTASRQVLLIQVPLIAILLYLRYFKKAKLINKILFIGIIAVAASIITPIYHTTYQDSHLQERAERTVQEDDRYNLAIDAIGVGFEHFPLGVGPNNYVMYSYSKHFSHNTFIELFANEGVIGLCLYIWLMLTFVKRQWRRFKAFRDYQYFVFLIFGIIYIFDSFFYVFYPHLWFMGFFMLVAAHSETYFNKHHRLNPQTHHITA